MSQTTTTTTFASRQIVLQFALGAGQSFGSSGSNTLTVSGLRVLATFTNSLGGFPPQAVLMVYGLTLEQMNRLTVAGRYIYGPNTPGTNTIGVAAGIVNGPMTTIFQGGIVEAYPDGEMPNMGFFIRAIWQPGLQFSKISPTSFNGAVPAATVMQTICQKIGLGFENNNVNAVLSYPYFAGSARAQLRECAAAANAYLCFDIVANTIAIFPKPSGSRKPGSLIVSPQTGMIGYPRFELAAIDIKIIYDPSMVFAPGVPFTVQSQFAAANGQWTPASVAMNLSSQMPNGPWEIIVRGYTNTTVSAPGGQ